MNESEKIYNHLKNVVTTDVAMKVKELRKTHTFRAIVRDIAPNYPKLKLRTYKDGSGFGLDGAILVLVSKEVLEETSKTNETAQLGIGAIIRCKNYDL